MDITTWISILAFLISFSTLLITFRKQQHDERIVLAKYIAEIKTNYGKGLKIVDDILKELNKSEKAVKDLKPDNIETINSIGALRLTMLDVKTRFESFYDKLGFRETQTSDPVALAAVVVESERIFKLLEQDKEMLKKLTTNKNI